MKESFIRREKQVKNFTVLPNDIFKIKMSLKATGLLCYLLSLPENWVIIKKELHNHFKDGRDATTAAFNELINERFITEEPIREKGKFAGKNFFVHDSQQPWTENPATVYPATEKPATENPTLLNTDSNKKPINKVLSVNSDKSELTGADAIEIGFGSVKAKKGTKKDPPVAGDPPPNNYTLLMAIYWDWYKLNNDGVQPKIDGAEGKGLKALQKYFEGLAKDRIKTDGLEATDQLVSEKVCEIFNYIFANWTRLEPFYQKQVKLAQINSNITNIINNLKNGRKTQSAQQAKQDRTGTIVDGFAAIENAFRT